MLFMLSLLFVAVFIVLLRKPLQKVPLAFYACALVFVALHIYANFAGPDAFFWRYVFVYSQRCTLALAFFTMVMFMGVLPEKSRLRALLLPIRRQLSILGGLLACGHITVYLSGYVIRFLSGITYRSANVLIALIVALLLTALLAVLVVTSFTQIHKRMNPAHWKKLQRLAYPFYLLIYVHIALIMLPSVAAGTPAVVLNFVVYTAVFLLYSVLRIVKAFAEKPQPVKSA